MKKYLKHSLVGTICLASIILFAPKANAAEISKDDVPNSTYVIGTHMFTRDTNEETGYNGQLTTKNIMIAAKTIESDDINDMIIYYKNPRGKWTDALTSNPTQAPDTLEINYKNLALQDVVAPVAPILYLNGPLQYDNTTGDFKYQLDVFIDDVDNKINTPDGVEIQIRKDGVYSCIDMNYHKDISSTIFSFNTEEDVNNYDNLVVLGKSYHRGFEDIDVNVKSDVYISAAAYNIDADGNKVYSDFSNSHSIKGLPKVTIKNNYSNPDYIVKEDNDYHYSIGIESLDAPAYKNDLDSFGYILVEIGDNSNKQLGKYSLEESVYLSIEENSVKKYEAHLVCYINGEIYYPQVDAQEFIIDTRKLTRPEWNGQPSYSSVTEEEYICINNEFYKKQEEDTLDYNILGTEIYEVIHSYESTKYKLIEDKSHALHVKPETGSGIYVARVYALNANNEIVYSDFSDEIYVVTTPKLEVSSIGDGKVSIKVSNSQDYMNGRYEIYTFNSSDGEVLLETANDMSDVLELEINSETIIYAKAYVNINGSKHYSDESVQYKVE